MEAEEPQNPANVHKKIHTIEFRIKLLILIVSHFLHK